MDEGAIGPRRCGLLSADPGLIALIVIKVQVESEALGEEPDRFVPNTCRTCEVSEELWRERYA